jgi:Tfp pilus assembly protein PilN
MKAVNLVPREAQRSFGAVRSLGAGTSGLFGVLAIAVAMVATYVVLSNTLTTKRSELATVNAQQATAAQQVSSLKRYDDLAKARTALLDRVRSLADGRYDWPQALGRVARAIPGDTTSLTALSGNAAADATAGPTFKLTGCTTSHDRLADVIDRLRAVQGVTAVSLQSAKLADAAGADCPHPEQFQLTLSLKAPASATAATAAGTPGATTAAPAVTPAPATTAPAPAATAAPATASTGGTK